MICTTHVEGMRITLRYDKEMYGTKESVTFSRINRVSYMSAQDLLNLLNELRKSDKMRGLPSFLLLFRMEFNKFNKTEHECSMLFII